MVKNESANWTHLIELLKEYMANLRTFGPEPDLGRLLKAQFNFLINMPPDQLQQIIQAAGYEANLAKISTRENQRSVPYEKIEQAARFRAASKLMAKRQSLLYFQGRISTLMITTHYQQPMPLQWPFFSTSHLDSKNASC